MNQSTLVIGDFEPSQNGSSQTIDIQSFSFPKLFQHIQQTDIKQTFFIRSDQPKQVFKKVKKDVTFVKAAGGIVRNERQQYLFIYRLGKWDLPKGKVEAGERYKATALREVEEECGIRAQYVEGKPYATYHTYLMDGQVTLKKTKWYAMYIAGDPDLTPQNEEDITEAKWFSLSELDAIKRNTYPLIKDLIEQSIEHE